MTLPTPARGTRADMERALALIPTRFGESTPEQLAQLAGVSVRTARRWRSSGRMPRAARILIALRLGWLELGALCPAWRGWRLAGGAIVSPEGWTFTPGELLALPIRYQQLRLEERQVAAELADPPARARARA